MDRETGRLAVKLLLFDAGSEKQTLTAHAVEEIALLISTASSWQTVSQQAQGVGSPASHYEVSGSLPPRNLTILPRPAPPY